MRGKAAVGVVALGVGLYLDAVVAAVLLEFTHLRGHVLFHLAGHDLVPGTGVLRLGIDRLVVEAEYLRESGGYSLRVLPVLLNLGGAEVNSVHPRTHGEHLALPVVNSAPRRADRGLAHLLGDSPGLQLVVLHNLQLIKPGRKHNKGGDAAHREQEQCAAKHHSVGRTVTGPPLWR